MVSVSGETYSRTNYRICTQPETVQKKTAFKNGVKNKIYGWDKSKEFPEVNNPAWS